MNAENEINEGNRSIYGKGIKNQDNHKFFTYYNRTTKLAVDESSSFICLLLLPSDGLLLLLFNNCALAPLLCAPELVLLSKSANVEFFGGLNSASLFNFKCKYQLRIDAKMIILQHPTGVYTPLGWRIRRWFDFLIPRFNTIQQAQGFRRFKKSIIR
uniref:Uncharacterized protein n=1 Tax=Romanomermis culicivorax TaxID=13658 RepID=A0A915JB97_ROMCU